MRKGAINSVSILILVLIILVIFIMVFFSGSGLYAKSKEQAIDKVKGAINTTASSDERITFEKYYGQVIILGSNKEHAKKLIADSVLKCLNLCKTHEENMFCYYFDASYLRDSFFFDDVKELIDEVEAKSFDDFDIDDNFKSEKIDLIGTVDSTYTNKDGVVVLGRSTPKFEMCCSQEEVHISKLNECMSGMR